MYAAKALRALGVCRVQQGACMWRMGMRCPISLLVEGARLNITAPIKWATPPAWPITRCTLCLSYRAPHPWPACSSTRLTLGLPYCTPHPQPGAVRSKDYASHRPGGTRYAWHSVILLALSLAQRHPFGPVPGTASSFCPWHSVILLALSQRHPFGPVTASSFCPCHSVILLALSQRNSWS